MKKKRRKRSKEAQQFLTAFGRKLKWVRMQRQQSLAGAAGALKLSIFFLDSLEKGKGGKVALPTIFRISAYYRYPVKELFDV